MQELGITIMDAAIALTKLPADQQEHVENAVAALAANTGMRSNDALAVLAAVGAWLAEHETD